MLIMVNINPLRSSARYFEMPERAGACQGCLSSIYMVVIEDVKILMLVSI